MTRPFPCPPSCAYCSVGPGGTPFKPCSRMRRYYEWLDDAEADELTDETPEEWHERRRRSLAQRPEQSIATHDGYDASGRRTYREHDPAKDYR